MDMKSTFDISNKDLIALLNAQYDEHLENITHYQELIDMEEQRISLCLKKLKELNSR